MSNQPIEPVDPLHKLQPSVASKFKHAIADSRLSQRTARTYQHWIQRFINYNNSDNPAELSEADVDRFLRYAQHRLALSRAKQNQARHAIQFLFENVLHQSLDRSARA